MKKRVISLLSIMMIGAVISGCGAKSEKAQDVATGIFVEESKKNASTKEITDKILESVEIRATGPIEGELAEQQYYLNLDDVEEFSIQNGMINTGLESIAIIKAKEGKVDSVKASLEKVKEDKKKAAFYPGEAESAEAAEIKVEGNYVGFFIVPDYEDGE